MMPPSGFGGAARAASPTARCESRDEDRKDNVLCIALVHVSLFSSGGLRRARRELGVCDGVLPPNKENARGPALNETDQLRILPHQHALATALYTIDDGKRSFTGRGSSEALKPVDDGLVVAPAVQVHHRT